MSFLWITKRPGQRVRGGGCIGCVPFGCLPVLAIVAGALAWVVG
jgi:hypothetical protein